MNEIFVNIDRAIQLTRQHVFFFDNVDPIRNQVHPELRDDGRFNNVNNRLAQVEARIRNFQTTVVGLLQRYEQADNVLLNNEITRVRDMQSQIRLAWVNKFNQARQTAEFGNREIVSISPLEDIRELDAVQRATRFIETITPRNTGGPRPPGEQRNHYTYMDEIERMILLELGIELESPHWLNSNWVNGLLLLIPTDFIDDVAIELLQLIAKEGDIHELLNFEEGMHMIIYGMLLERYAIFRNHGNANQIKAFETLLERYRNPANYASTRVFDERTKARDTIHLGIVSSAFKVFKPLKPVVWGYKALNFMADHGDGLMWNRRDVSNNLLSVYQERYAVLRGHDSFSVEQLTEMKLLQRLIIDTQIRVIELELEIEKQSDRAQRARNFGDDLDRLYERRIQSAIPAMESRTRQNEMEQLLEELHQIRHDLQETSIPQVRQMEVFSSNGVASLPNVEFGDIPQEDSGTS